MKLWMLGLPVAFDPAMKPGDLFKEPKKQQPARSSE